MEIKLILLLIFVCTLLTSCGSGEKEVKFFAPSMKFFRPYVNEGKAQQGNLNLDTHFYTNDEYPVEIYLYKDKTFYYNLPSLGSGTGHWEYESGILKLSNKHYFSVISKVIEMNYEIKSLDPKGEELMIFFRDRFGLKSYPLVIKNMPLESELRHF